MNIKEKISSLSIQDWIFSIFSIIWVVAVVLDYLNKQVLYIPSITHFKYSLLFGVLSIIGLALSGSFIGFGPLKFLPRLKINGLLILGLIIGIVIAIVAAYNQYWQAPLVVSNYMHLAYNVLFTFGAGAVVCISTYSLGNSFRSLLDKPSASTLTSHLLDIALGFMIYSLVMMLLGALGVLEQPVLLGTLLLPILYNYKSSFRFIKKIFWDNIKKPTDLNIWGAFLSFMILVYVSMNYLYTQAPFPLGFDARNYYVNISKLIAESAQLIEGFQPYAWSLIMSTGFIAFSSPEVTMFLSVLGGLLSLIAMYDLSKHHLGLGSNYSFLVVLLYLITPTVTNHFIIEFKVDLSLVFVQIVVISYLLNWIKNKTPEEAFLSSTKDRNHLIILGLLLGFCLSIKVLSLFLIIALLVSFWWYHNDLLAVLGSASVFFGIILLMKLDELSGLRAYHLSPNLTGAISFGLGTTLLGISFYKSNKQFINMSKAIMILGFSALLVFSPWIYKNYVYTKSSSLSKLIIGAKPSPTLTTIDILNNYKKSQRNKK